MKSIRTMLCAAVAACGMTLGTLAFAQSTITISLPSSVTCTANGTAITCTSVGGGSPSCSISGNSTGVIGDSITLTGSCFTASGAADSMTWGGCGTAVGSTCTMTAAGTATLTGGTGGSASKTVSFGAATCSVTPVTPVITAGNSQTFTAGCNFTPTSYAWVDSTGNASCGSSATCTLPGSATTAGASGTMSVTASKAGGVSAIGSTTWSASSGSGGGTIPAVCTDGTKSVTGSTISTFSGQRVIAGKLKKDQTMVIPVVMPASGAVSIKLYEYGDDTDRTSRDFWISKTPCYSDPNSSTAAGQYQSHQWASGTSQATMPVTIGANSYLDYGRNGSTLKLYAKPGETWYFMVQDATSSACGAYASSGCTVAVDASAI